MSSPESMGKQTQVYIKSRQQEHTSSRFLGDLMAIMGPSGGGKTTLLNSLAHRQAKGMNQSGSIMVNNTKASKTLLQNVSSYVEQEDALIGSLTVRETMEFAARLSLPRPVASQQSRFLTS